jgi:hypothetical protein
LGGGSSPSGTRKASYVVSGTLYATWPGEIAVSRKALLFQMCSPTPNLVGGVAIEGANLRHKIETGPVFLRTGSDRTP